MSVDTWANILFGSLLFAVVMACALFEAVRRAGKSERERDEHEDGGP